MLVVEDLHWADRALLEFLEHLTDWSEGVPMLLLCSARPELYERVPGWGGGKRNSTTISLSPLSAEDSARLISALLDQAVLPAETQTLLLERAGGNPLYTEEFVRMLSDRGLLVRHGQSWAVEPGSEILVPESVQALIAARLDSLPQDRKALLHDASVVGKVFWSGALSAMGAVDETTVRDGLHELARRELVRPARRSSVEHQAEFSFWHLFIRDVAYEQIPRATRANRHRAVAEWIERISGDRAGDQAELLAHHYGQALDLARASGQTQDVAELEALTVRYLVMAGDRAVHLDVSRARRHLGNALELLPPGHPRRAGVLVKAALAARAAGDYDESEHGLQEAIADFRGREELVAAGEAMIELTVAIWPRGDTARAWHIIREAVELLEGEPPGRELARAYVRTAGAYAMSGQSEEGMPWAEKAIATAKELGIEEYVARTLQFRGIFRCELGDIGGLEDLREGLRLCHELALGDPTVAGHNNLGDWVWFEEGPAAGLEIYRAGIEFGERHGLTGVVVWTKAQTLWTLFDLGAWDELVRTGDEVIESDRTGGGGQVTVIARTYQARVLAERGLADEASSFIHEFLPRAREIKDPQVLVPALGMAALIELGRGDHAAARSLVEEFEGSTRRHEHYRTLFLPDTVRFCAATGRIDLAERLVAGAPESAARFRHGALTARAILAEAKGRLDEAADLYAEAAERWTEYGFVLERGQALLRLGRCSLGLGRSGEAIDRLHLARVVFDGLGAKPLLAATDDLLEQATALSS
ncbi:MAG: ATP-binding protein [Actinomycetota bacterium]